VKDYLPESLLDADALYQKLLGYIQTMKDPFYRALAEAVFQDDSEITDRVKRAPAAKTIHHAYPTGLLEHMVSITGILDALSHHYGEILDRDLLFLGGFFHDIGKILRSAKNF
jgi:3'-5' exoribonuclease